jgi:bacteriorhodopsin
MVQASIIKDDPIQANLVKYVYWLASTPIIMIQLAELLDGMRMIAWIILLDVLCMATGLLAWMLGESTSLRWILYGVSCMAAIFMFGMVGVLFYCNHQLLGQAGYMKEQRIYSVIATIYFAGWTVFPIVFVLGFEGVGVMNEDAMCVAHVLLDLVCKDITEVLIVWVSYCFTARLSHLSQKKITSGLITPMEQSYANMMTARVPRHTSMYDHLERENTQGLRSQMTLPSAPHTPKQVHHRQKQYSDKHNAV